MKKYNTGKKYLTEHRKSKILMARIVTAIVAVPVLILVGAVLYTNNYSVISEARAEVPAKPKEMTLYQQISDATNGENVDVIYNLCKAESKCWKWAVNVNRNGTKDYSWLQINEIHIKSDKHPNGTITMDCVYDLPCVSRWSNQQIKNGRLHIWATTNKI